VDFKSIISRVRGFSVPVFGVSWDPPEPEKQVAQRVVRFLEDRRVLFNPPHMEFLPHCVESVVEMRTFLTNELGALGSDGVLVESLVGMRAACRKFMNQVRPGRSGSGVPMWGEEGGELMAALGELRGVVGIHLARLAVAYGIDVEDELSQILPTEPNE
jgi:hypothetical protein